MERDEPLLFRRFPDLKKKVPWIPILTNVPTSIERLKELENNFGLNEGEIYIKRDDKNHHIYGGNKYRKFEFIFGDVIQKKKKGIVTVGGIGTNHGIACTILCKILDPPLKCEMYLYPQPITWHVQRTLLLDDYFGAKLHFIKGDIRAFIKALFLQIRHPKYYFIMPGGSLLFGIGSPLGAVGFIDAIFELKEQIENGEIPEPDALFVAGGSTGTAAGLVAGCKLLNLKTKIIIVAVYEYFVSNPSSVIKNANKALKYLYKRDKSISKIRVTENDFEFVKGYLGSRYGIKTERGQKAVDIVNELEGKNKDFMLETTYTGKTMAAMFEYLKKDENKNKKVLFWNTYNSNDLDKHLKEIGNNYKKLPKKFHKFFENKTFQCWQITNCPEKIRNNCPAYFNHEYRFWKVTDCLLEEEKKIKAFEELNTLIKLEDA
ncbi:MAG: 1-aminocyclopropane-1-carboxylate deaminase/D-cysteine desulfhydrase [Promethearchaeota archaeon]